MRQTKLKSGPIPFFRSIYTDDTVKKKTKKKSVKVYICVSTYQYDGDSYDDRVYLSKKSANRRLKSYWLSFGDNREVRPLKVFK